jgi:hypothetical protein
VIVGADAGIARETSTLSRRLRAVGRIPVDTYGARAVDQCMLPISYVGSIKVG